MKILLVDDELLLRDCLKIVLEARGHEIVGAAADGEEAIALASRNKPDVVLMDLHMPRMDGLAATRAIRRICPGTKVVLLTNSDRQKDLCEAMRAGVDGFLLKSLDAKRAIELLERIEFDEPALDPKTARRLLAGACQDDPNDSNALTHREQEVLAQMVDGTTSTRALAGALGVSENTVKFHLANLLNKLNLHSRAELVAHALRNNLVCVTQAL